MARKQVLLVDDDPKFSTLLSNALQQEQVDVTVSPRAADATIETNYRDFDLIILDGELPDMNGMAWLEEYRKSGKSTPVMFVSASWRDTTSHQRMITELNVGSVVHKPVSLEVLVDETLRLVRKDATPSNAVDNAVAALLAGYLSEIAVEFQKMASFVRNAPAHGLKNYETDSIVNSAHKIHGTGGVYGLDELSRIAGALEAEFKTMAAEGVLPDARRAKLTSHLQHAADEIKRATVTSESKSKQAQAQQSYYDRVAGPNAKRVLIVDDDTFFLKRLEHLLAAEGILLNSYSDSAHVLDAIERFAPNLVVLDVNMPGLNGFEVCSAIRSKSEYSALPILVMSADSSDETQSNAMSAGATGFEAKPIKNMRFVEKIKEMLG